MKVLIVEPLAQEGLDLLASEHEVDYRPGLGRAELLEAVPSCEALIVRSQARVDAELFDVATRLRVVGRAGVGTDNIDLNAATAAGVTVVNAPTANTIAAAELTMALLLALVRNVAAADASLRRGEWRRADFMGRELYATTLGVVGLGKIGLAVAERARAFGMRLLGSDPYVTAEAAAEHAIDLVDLDTLLRSSDAVTLHVPLNDQTRGLIDRRALALMQPGAVLVNVARGGLVDEQALAAALAESRLAGAAVDVYEHEPPRDSPLVAAQRTVLTPHLGASTTEAQTRAGIEVAEQVMDVLAGRTARYAVNRPEPAPLVG